MYYLSFVLAKFELCPIMLESWKDHQYYYSDRSNKMPHHSTAQKITALNQSEERTCVWLVTSINKEYWKIRSIHLSSLLCSFSCFLSFDLTHVQSSPSLSVGKNFVWDLLAKSRGLLSWSCRRSWRRIWTVVDALQDVTVDGIILVRCGTVCPSAIGKGGGGLDSVCGSDLPWPLDSIDKDVPRCPRVHRNAVQMSKLTTRGKPFDSDVVYGHNFNVLETNRLRTILPFVVFQIPSTDVCRMIYGFASIHSSIHGYQPTVASASLSIDRKQRTKDINREP